MKKINVTRALYVKVGTILLKEWDPIGIQNIPEAQDEYNAYIFSICELLISGKSENEIFNCLWWIETEHMGLPGNKQHTKIISKKLAGLFKTF